jgi:hypothetical protein
MDANGEGENQRLARNFVKGYAKHLRFDHIRGSLKWRGDTFELGSAAMLLEAYLEAEKGVKGLSDSELGEIVCMSLLLMERTRSRGQDRPTEDSTANTLPC